MAKIEKRLAKNLSKEDYKKCRSLSYRGDGYMSEALYQCYKHYRSHWGKVYMIKEGDKILSWALIFKDKDDEYVVHYYTRKSERRKGLATRISKQIDKDFNQSDLWCDNHDEISTEFYSKFKYKKGYYDE